MRASYPEAPGVLRADLLQGRSGCKCEASTRNSTQDSLSLSWECPKTGMTTLVGGGWGSILGLWGHTHGSPKQEMSAYESYLGSFFPGLYG